MTAIYLTKGSSTTLIVPAPMRPVKGTNNYYYVDPRGAVSTKGVVYYEMPEEPYYERVYDHSPPQVVTKVPGMLGYRVATPFVEDGDALVEQNTD